MLEKNQHTKPMTDEFNQVNFSQRADRTKVVI
jgi:hypothetical protein